MARISAALKQTILKETALFFGLLFFGFVIMPIGIYFVGQAIFGDYGGYGYGDFFGALSARIRSGAMAAWFLVLSPYLIWQTLRLSLRAWQFLSESAKSTGHT